MASTPGVGDIVYLSSAMAKMVFYGVVTTPDSPDQFAASMELQGDQGVVTMPVLTGAPGPAGQPCFALRFQADLDVSTEADLPTTLTNTQADIGKYWVLDDLDAGGNVVGSSAYIWFGGAFRRLMMGTQGPAGPVPIITPSVEVIAPEETSTIVTGGSSYQPSWHFKIAAPRGFTGPASKIAVAPDIDFTTRPPEPGDVLGFTGEYDVDGDAVWKPVSISALIPSPYSMPQSAFQDTGLVFVGNNKTLIGSLQIPPQPFPWTPIVWGHLKISGVTLVVGKIFEVGCEVRLGAQSQGGQMVGRGFGNTFGEVNIMPHYSTPLTPGVAISPGNGRAVVPANHSNPAQGTLYVNMWNDGAPGTYDFNPENAQLFVMVVPIDAADSLTRSSDPSALEPRPA